MYSRKKNLVVHKLSDNVFNNFNNYFDNSNILNVDIYLIDSIEYISVAHSLNLTMNYVYKSSIIEPRPKRYNIQLINLDLSTTKLEEMAISLSKVGINKSESNTRLTKNQSIDAIWKHVTTDFDFNVCRNIYYNENNFENVKIFDIDAIINKVIKFDQSNHIVDYTRIQKYRIRGFEVNIPIDENRLIQIINEFKDGSNPKPRLYFHNKFGGPFYYDLRYGIYYMVFECMLSGLNNKKIKDTLIKNYQGLIVNYGHIEHFINQRYNRRMECLFVKIGDFSKKIRINFE